MVIKGGRVIGGREERKGCVVWDEPIRTVGDSIVLWIG